LDNHAAVLRLQRTQPKDRRVYNAPYRILCMAGDAAGQRAAGSGDAFSSGGEGLLDN